MNHSTFLDTCGLDVTCTPALVNTRTFFNKQYLPADTSFKVYSTGLDDDDGDGDKNNDN